MTTATDRMMREAEQAQAQAVDLEQIQGADAITGVELNSMSTMVTIYHRQTGEPRQMPRLAAEIALTKKYRRLDDPLRGQFIFSAKPTKPYHYGTQKCLLHPDNPERGTYDTWGLPVCTSAHLASGGEVQRHMQKRHTSAAELIKTHEEKLRQERLLEAQEATGQAIAEALNQMVNTQRPAAVRPARPRKPAVKKEG